jgi:hypothetical protein
MKLRTIAAILAATGLMAAPFAEAAQGSGGGGGAAGGGGGGAAGGGGGGGGGVKPAKCASTAVPGQPGVFIITCSNKRP